VVCGTVYDPARASIPGVTIVLTHMATNTTREAPTNEVGFFLFASLPPDCR
jgi:Carboxypeptidase regulatory-like domain